MDDVDYVIPANDDAIRAVKLISSKMGRRCYGRKAGESMDDAEAANAAAGEGEKSIERSLTQNNCISADSECKIWR